MKSVRIDCHKLRSTTSPSLGISGRIALNCVFGCFEGAQRDPAPCIELLSGGNELIHVVVASAALSALRISGITGDIWCRVAHQTQDLRPSAPLFSTRRHLAPAGLERASQCLLREQGAGAGPEAGGRGTRTVHQRHGLQEQLARDPRGAKSMGVALNRQFATRGLAQ